MSEYRNPALRQLKEQQVRFAPTEKKLEQLERIEKLFSEISAEKTFPYQYICFRITGFKTDLYPKLMMEGKDLEHDLKLFAEELAKTVPAIPVENVSEPMLTLEQVSKNLKVSTKTVSRWRDRGLVTRMIIANGRKKVAVRQSILNKFLNQHQMEVTKNTRFTLMNDGEKQKIIDRARRFAKVNPERFMDICRRVAKKFGRSVEAIRYTLKRFDQAHPESAIFPHQKASVEDQDRQVIYSSFRRGITVDALAQKFNRTRTAVQRIINEVRAQRLLGHPVDYMHSPEFDDPNMIREIMGDMPEQEKYNADRAKARASQPSDVPPELASLYGIPLLNREQERHLFRKMNFIKHQARQLQKNIDPTKATLAQLERLEELLRDAQNVKEQLIGCNMRLVASVAKKHVRPSDNFFELMSDGNISLIKAVEKFDYSRGNKFSTYATWAIMKNYARSLPDEQTRRDRFMTGNEDIFDAVPDLRSNERAELITAESRKREVHRLLDKLDEREQRIMRLRFGIGGERGLTLEQVGAREGITKERVRQIEARGLLKLKSMANTEADV